MSPTWWGGAPVSSPKSGWQTPPLPPPGGDGGGYHLVDASPTFASGPAGELARKNAWFMGKFRVDADGNRIKAPDDPGGGGVSGGWNPGPYHPPGAAPSGGGSGGGGGGGWSGVMSGDKFQGGVASGSYTQQGAAQDTADRNAAFATLSQQNRDANNKAGNMFAKPPAQPPAQAGSTDPGLANDPTGGVAADEQFQGYWHGGPPPTGQPVVVGDKRPGSKAKGPFPEKFVPDNPRLKPVTVGRKGPEVIQPKVPGKVIPNKKNVQGLPLPHLWTGGDVGPEDDPEPNADWSPKVAADAPTDVPPVNVTAKLPTPDQQAMAASWLKPNPGPTQEQQGGVTHWADGNVTISNAFGRGATVPLNTPKSMSDERGQMDVTALDAKASQPSVPWSEQVFARNRGQTEVPYKADVVPSGSPWNTGIAPPDPWAPRASIDTAFHNPSGHVPTPTLEQRAAPLAQSMADEGLDPAKVQSNWTGWGQPQGPSGPTSLWTGQPTIRTPQEAQAILDRWEREKQRDPTTGQQPAWTTGDAQSGGGSIRDMLSPAARAAWDRTHGANTMRGQAAQLEYEMGTIGAQRKQAMEIALKDHEAGNTLGIHTFDQAAKDKRQATSLAAKAKAKAAAPQPLSQEQIQTLVDGGHKVTMHPDGRYSIDYQPPKPEKTAKQTHAIQGKDGNWYSFDETGKPVQVQPEMLPAPAEAPQRSWWQWATGAQAADAAAAAPTGGGAATPAKPAAPATVFLKQFKK